MRPTALIVAHGQPSDPAPAEADLARLAAQVGALLPGWQARSATLAAPGALEAAADGAAGATVMPFFMADGWFTRSELPRRLALAGIEPDVVLPAFGLLPAVSELAVRALRSAAIGRGWDVARTVVVLAAHGSGRSRAPAEAAGIIRDRVAAEQPFADVRLGFIEEEPALAEAARYAGAQALCLPLFVARWGHVLSDLPQALAAAAFRGPCLAPIGVRPEVPGLLAAAIRDVHQPAGKS